ncbi:MAG: IS1182 family transposase [Gammaproteobacteria bacterium]|nr:IS1182 family transposase [Gammaproteobacteria bacterium]
MPTTFRPYQPDQALLLAPSLREWLPEGHLADHVSDLVDGLDLSAFYAPYEGDGRRKSPYEPAMMVKVLIYGYATGVFSSRGMARRLEEDVAFRVLAAGNFPSHRTICEFRRRHLADFKRLFAEVVRLAREMGVANFGKLSIDGTKVRANASKRKAMSYGRMLEEERRLEGEIGALLDRARETDAAEDARFGKDFRGDELPQELKRREDRLAAIRAAKKRLEARQREADAARGRKPGMKRNPKGGRPYKRAYGEPEEQAQDNFTDPESRIMKTSQEGFQQCYNAQVAVEGENQLIVATEVSSSATDQGRMVPLLDEVETTFGERPASALADAGYCNEADLATLEDRGVDGYVALGREGRRDVSADAEKHPAKARMAEKLATAAGRARYAERKWLSEAPNGWIKEALGFRRFSVRGLDKARGEWGLVCLALNIRRLRGLQAA